MADEPKPTVMLSVQEWRQLALLGLTELHQALNAVPTLAAEDLGVIDQRVERFKNWCRQWQVAGAQAAAVATPTAAPDDEQKAVNGITEEKARFAAWQETHPGHSVVPPKKKPGWPAGKKRTKRASDNQATV